MDTTERQIDVGGRTLFLRCRGRGRPAVVLEAGAGWGCDAWTAVMEQVAGRTRVCSYDRAGVGRSTPPPGPRTVQEIAAELQTFLQAAGIAGPYVLVGHSLGGFIVRLFAHRYPEAVAGVVLVDVPHPEYPRRALALMPPPAADDGAELREARAFFTRLIQGADDPEQHPERLRLGVSLAQLAGAGRLGDMPLVVLTAGRTAPYSADFPPALTARLDRLRAAQQREIAALSSAGRQIVAAQSGHMIQHDQPALVVEAIEQVLAEARRG